jgi:hypothetical protein
VVTIELSFSHVLSQKLAVFVKCKTTLTSEALAELYIQNVWRVYGRIGKLVSDNEPILCVDAWLDIHKKLGTNLNKWP